MSDRATKIDKHGLGPRILQLSLREFKRDREIFELLKEEGFHISLMTISRWLKKHKGQSVNEVQAILHSHNVKELPKDLDALERMEAMALNWSEEEPAETVEKLPIKERAMAALEEWREMLAGAVGEKDQIRAVHTIIRQVSKWVMETINDRKDRINYMRMATNIIETKLRFSGVIDSEGTGNIIIKTSSHDAGEKKVAAPGARKLFVVKTGKIDTGTNDAGKH